MHIICKARVGELNILTWAGQAIESILILCPSKYPAGWEEKAINSRIYSRIKPGRVPFTKPQIHSRTDSQSEICSVLPLEISLLQNLIIIQETSYLPSFYFFHLWILSLANFHTAFTTGVKPAPFRRVDSAGHLTFDAG